MPPSAEPRSPLVGLLEQLAQAIEAGTTAEAVVADESAGCRRHRPIESRRGDEAIVRLLKEAHAACQDAARHASGEAKTHLTNFLQALETWHRMWPQMGVRPEFRQAVVREARAWANRMRTLT